jgi:hypothetical protein
MVKWKIKGCSRCGGTTFIEHDIDGWYEQCIICSHRMELEDSRKFNDNRKENETRAKET